MSSLQTYEAPLAAPAKLAVRPASLVNVLLAITVIVSCVNNFEPSPFLIALVFLFPAALLEGAVITRATIALFFVIWAKFFTEALSLFPYLSHREIDLGVTPAYFTLYSSFVYIGLLSFALIFSKQTKRRIDIFLAGYAASCVLASVWAIVQYAEIFGVNPDVQALGRAMGPFKDPNVLGSFCILGATYLFQSILLSNRRLFLKVASLATIVAGGIFLSFSRGAWGATAISIVFVAVSTFVTAADKRVRRRVVMTVMGAIALGFVGSAYVASNDALSAMLEIRAKVSQDYDSGEDGRFGHQRRSIPMLLQRPLGFGPFRFPVYFDFEPHNSYISAFADAGWLGGIAHLFFVGATLTFAVRAAFTRSPFMAQAQAILPAIVAIDVQAFQIDEAHWRFMYMAIAAIWAFEGARPQWKQAKNAAAPAH